MVEIRHGSGVYLLAKEPEQIVLSLAVTLAEQNQRLPEAMEARMALERFIAGLAASRRTEADLDAARRALEDMDAEIAAGELGTSADARFHEALWSAAHNAVLQGLLESLAEPIARIREESLSQSGRPHRSLAAHWRILDAVERRDPSGAVAAMDAHLWEVADTLLLGQVRGTDAFRANAGARDGEPALDPGRRARRPRARRDDHDRRDARGR